MAPTRRRGRVAEAAGVRFADDPAVRRFVKQLTGRPTTADFPDGELEQAPPRQRQLVAVAGSTAEAVFGVGLLAAAGAAGERWGPLVQETVVVCGALHGVALAHLLPLAQTDGHLVWGRAWQTRPTWVGLLPVVVVLCPVPLALTALAFPQGSTRAWLAWLATPDGAVRLVVAALSLLPLLRRLLFPSPAAAPAGPARYAACQQEARRDG